MNPFGGEPTLNIQSIQHTLQLFYTTKDTKERKKLERQLLDYMYSENGIKLLGSVVGMNDDVLTIYACNAFHKRIRMMTLTVEQINFLVQHLTSIQFRYQLTQPIINKIVTSIAYLISMYSLQTLSNPLSLIITIYSDLSNQLHLLHQIYDTILVLPASESSSLSQLLNYYQRDIMYVLLNTSHPDVIITLSDSLVHSTSFPVEYTTQLLTIVFNSLQHSQHIEEALDIFSNFIKYTDVIQPPLIEITSSILQCISQLNMSYELEVLVNFCIKFYNTPLLLAVSPVLMKYCKQSIEYCVVVMNFFEEMYMCYDDTPELTERLQLLCLEYLKILLLQCIVKSNDDDVIVLRSELRSGLNCVAEILGDKYKGVLEEILLTNKNNGPLQESVCFVWEAVLQLPIELQSVHIYRPDL
ncbi:Importin N-terminal domain-containing protein [Entamoeba marina]